MGGRVGDWVGGNSCGRMRRRALRESETDSETERDREGEREDGRRSPLFVCNFLTTRNRVVTRTRVVETVT